MNIVVFVIFSLVALAIASLIASVSHAAAAAAFTGAAIMIVLAGFLTLVRYLRGK